MTKKKIIILSPHPYDECLNGLIPLKLSNYEIHNFAMSLGSNVERQQRRKEELEQACKYLNFNLRISEFDQQTIDQINELKPDIIICPHDSDRHPTHEKVARFLIDNSHQLNDCLVFFTEYWFPQKDPNLLLEASEDQIITLINAIKCHVGEIERNPYHETFRAWLMDNCRRGFEYLQGYGENEYSLQYGNLYKIQLLRDGKLKDIKSKHIVSSSESLSSLIEQITIEQ